MNSRHALLLLLVAPTLMAQDCDQDGVPRGEDCADRNPDISPASFELCNGIDEDCDGVIDEGSFEVLTINSIEVFRDRDGDGHGAGEPEYICNEAALVAGWSLTADDCWDTDDEAKIESAAQVYPGAASKEPDLCGRDNDKDGYAADASNAVVKQGPETVETGTDCDDSAPTIHAMAAEECDPDASEQRVDEDCDGKVDEGVATTFWKDADGDGYGGEVTEWVCGDEAPTGGPWVTVEGDCDDDDTGINPGITCEPDGEDLNCNSDEQLFDCPGTCAEAGVTGEAVLSLDDDDGTTFRVRCDEDGYALLTTELLGDHPEWTDFEFTRKYNSSNSIGYDPDQHCEIDGDGLLLGTVRDTSYNGYSMCVRAVVEIPWAVSSIRGEWTARSDNGDGTCDDDGPGTLWAPALNYQGHGQIRFGVTEAWDGSDDNHQVLKSGGDWGKDIGVRTFEMEDNVAAAGARFLLWEYCDDGLNGEDLLVDGIELWVLAEAE